MLCGKVDGLDSLNLNNYIAEEKMDGERIIVIKKGNNVKMINRRNLEKANVYIEIKEELEKLPFDFYIDGEVCAKTGLFNDLQRRALLRDNEEIKIRKIEIPVMLHIFDMISLNGVVIADLPLMERKDKLKIFNGYKLNNAKVIDWVAGQDNIKQLWNNIKQQNKEGIILKVKSSMYYYGRSNNWLKLKAWHEIKIAFDKYEKNNAGVKITDGFNEVQVQGLPRAEYIINKMDNGNKVNVIVQYLEKIMPSGKLRFPSCKEVIGYD